MRGITHCRAQDSILDALVPHWDANVVDMISHEPSRSAPALKAYKSHGVGCVVSRPDENRAYIGVRSELLSKGRSCHLPIGDPH
jgi:hypothetical protein